MDLDLYNRTAELAVLACCLQAKQARVRAREQMTGADFSQPQHEEIWDAMERLDAADREIDPAALLSVVRHKEELARIVVDLVGYPAVSEAVDTHAHEVRLWATKRRMWDEMERTRQQIFQPNVDVIGLAAAVANRFTAIRDVGSTEDIEAMTVEELLLEVDEEPDWLIPGFLERGDRFMLTGEEGLGKSHLLRQVVLLAAAGLDPLRPDAEAIEPVRGMVIDFENSKRQVRRRLRSTYEYALAKGQGAPGLATILSMPRSDITADRVLSRIHRELDACQPEVLAIGPLYRMSPKALQSDDEAGPVLAALDTIRDRGIALLIEAHAGHTKSSGGTRDLRPRGSSALLGWPEFGYGMRATSSDSAMLVPWRGDRDARDFPLALRKTGHGMWEEERSMTLGDVYAAREQQSWNQYEWTDDD